MKRQKENVSLCTVLKRPRAYNKVVFLNDHYSNFVHSINRYKVKIKINLQQQMYIFVQLLQTADEHLAELMPIFERIRAQEQVPCAFPIHMGAGGTVFVRCNSSRSVPLSPHVMHCHPTTHWVSFIQNTDRSTNPTTDNGKVCRTSVYRKYGKSDIFGV